MEIATKDPEYRELRWRITAQEYRDAVNMARDAGLYRVFSFFKMQGPPKIDNTENLFQSLI
jgi:hypothetical protein